MQKQLNALPAFANEEVKRAYGEYQNSLSVVVDLDGKIASFKERICQMNVHSSSVLDDLRLHDTLLRSRKDDEVSLIEQERVLLTQLDRNRSDSQRMQKESSRVQELINSSKDEFAILSKKLLSARERVEGGESHMENLESIRESNLDDERMLSEYTHQDSIKIQQLQTELLSLSLSHAKSKSEYERSVGVVHAIKLESEGMLSNLKNLRTEKSLIESQISDIILESTKLDDKLVELGNEYVSVLAIEKSLSTQKDSLIDQLTIAESQRIVVDRQISNSSLGRLRENVQVAETVVTELGEQIRAKQRESLTIRGSMTQLRNELSLNQTQLARAQTQLKIAEQEQKREQERFAFVSQGKSGSDTEVLEANRVLEEAEESLRKCEVQIQEIKSKILYEYTACESLRCASSNLMIEMNALEIEFVKLPETASRLRGESIEIDQELGAIEQEIHYVKSQLSNLSGEVSSDTEKANLLARIQELERMMKLQLATKLEIESRIRKEQSEFQLNKKIIEKLNIEINSENENLHDIQIHIEAIDRDEVATRESLVDTLVSRDKRIADIIDTKSQLAFNIKELFNIQSALEELEVKIQKRKCEESVQLDQLRAINKELSQQRHSLRIELGEMEKINAQLEAKYTDMNHTRVGIDDPHSTASRLIRDAQERDRLSKEIESLQTAIEKSDMELRAMDDAFVSVDDGNRYLVQQADNEINELSKILDQRRSELETLISQKATPAIVNFDDVLVDETSSLEARKKFVYYSFHEWRKCVEEILLESDPKMYEKIRLNLLLKGISLS